MEKRKRLLFLVLTFAFSFVSLYANSDNEAEAALYALLFGELPPEQAPSDPLYIAKISAEAPPSFTEAYILSFARGVERGLRLTRGELEQALEDTRLRLESSGMFYQFSAGYRQIPEDDIEGKDAVQGEIAVELIITVSDGFWWSFNFSPWDFSLGYANLFGSGKSVAMTAGLNTQALQYADPAINNGPWSFTIGAAHSVGLDGGGSDPRYLKEIVAGTASIGLHPTDRLRLALNVESLLVREPPEYFLYPDYSSLSITGLEAVGMDKRFQSVLSPSLTVAFGADAFKRRGGFRATASLSALARLPEAQAYSPVYEFQGSIGLRYDTPGITSIGFNGWAQYYCVNPKAVGLPEFLWASPTRYRGPARPFSGTFAALGRINLSFDSVASFNLGFTTLRLIPEFFGEAAVSQRPWRSPDLRLRADCGVLLKAAFSPPLGRVFSVGFAADLSSSEPSFTFVFEVE